MLCWGALVWIVDFVLVEGSGKLGVGVFHGALDGDTSGEGDGVDCEILIKLGLSRLLHVTEMLFRM